MPTPHLPIPHPPLGLSQSEAQERLKQQGPNELPAPPSRGVVWGLVDVVTEPMFLLLLACGSIYMMLGDLHEALMLLAFVFLVIGITFVQERRTEHSLSALRDLSSPRALVVRDGATHRIAGRELVVGDIVVLAEGDRVPADVYLAQASNLWIDESLLTGESAPVQKSPSEVPAEPHSDSKAFSGTLVTQGTGWGEVVATGRASALGQIGASLASIRVERTPIQIETALIVRRAAIAGLLLAAVLAGFYGWSRDDWLRGLLAGLTLAMGLLPEELPVVLTIFMGLGAWRLAQANVLTRHTPAIELLGATTVLCVDKTGTLTTNHMQVRRLCRGEETYDLAPIAPGGGAESDTHEREDLPERFHELLEFAVLASHRQAFDPTETAIGEAGHHWLGDTEHLHADWGLVEDYPLSPGLLAMSRVWRAAGRSEHVIACKGAPEAILGLCRAPDELRHQIENQVNAMAQNGLRVLGVARAGFADSDLPEQQQDFQFSFLGLIGLEDPVRADVPSAIAECRSAGIRVVMITGDHAATARSIARQAGLAEPSEVMTGTELEELSDETLQERLSRTHVFCRVQPEQKLRLVQAFKARGDIVTMTGDGVNDAPALKAAHIGVAMGARGTDVAREAASLVLLQDDFASLVTAVRHGRRIFSNLRKTMVFLIAVHLPIIGLSALPILLGHPLLLMPVHILLLQLIIDPACSIVFEAEPPEPGAMTLPPRAPGVHLFDGQVLVRGLLQGLGLLTSLVLADWFARHQLQASPDDSRALIITLLVLSSLGLILVNRSWQPTGWLQTLTRNPAFIVSSAAIIALMVLIFLVPPLRDLLAFGSPDAPASWIALGSGLGINLIWFEWVKRACS